ncbi:MAG: hypothetical protein QOH31_6053 [Verrucomicrobiota bacterium]
MPNPRLLNWIIQNFFEVPPLLDDHQTEQTRVANPLPNWLRNVALLVEKKLKLQEWLRSSEIAASSSPGVSSADEKKARGDATSAVGASGNGETLPPPGRRDAAAALERLEAAEESAHRRLEVALASGDRFRTQDSQDFWLKLNAVKRCAG